jgi:hypothetical protein
MARNSRPTAAKREREKGLIERRERKAASPRAADGVDPDIAGIKVGPQPPAEWQVEEDS